ncbi:MAG: 4a-hydroxytetrahydrobiopterin dehydratase [Planctomycetota bacterium]|nr:4a-hydroxytetrahydrobiopterin dehydratase [Planctomycetota bacterium]
MAGRTPPRALAQAELAAALAGRGLGAWSFEPTAAGDSPPAGDAPSEPPTGELVRQLRFPSFAAAIAFLADLAPACDAADHHPTWTNTYDRLEVRLATHEAGGRVTQRDLDLAAVMEARFGDLHGD